MKVELKKTNEPDGSYWYGVFVSNRCASSHGTDLDAAIVQFNKTVDVQMKPKLPPFEIIKSTEI